MQVIQSIEISAPIDFVFDCLADYEAYPRFLENVDGCIKRKLDDRLYEVTFDVSYIRAFHFVITVHEDPPYFLAWRMKSGDLKDNSGSWELTSAAPELTLVRYACLVRLGCSVPPDVNRLLVAVALPEMLQAFKDDIEAKYEQTRTV